MKRFLRVLLTVLLVCLMGLCAAEEYVEERVITVSPLRAVLSVTGGRVEICATEIDGETWLFLPAFAAPDGMALTLDGQRVTLGELQPDEELEGVSSTQVFSGSETLMDVRVMQSANLRTLFLISDDPVNEGREYIDNCAKHENATTASMMLVGDDASVDHSGAIRKLRGRGNGTWVNPKKPYQFKLEDRKDLLDTGLDSERERTWVLLAEASGRNLVHNRIVLDMALELGLSETSHSEHVDLYYDGEYRGTYLLTEKVEIGTGRINETDYEEMVEIWNEQAGTIDLTALAVGEGANRFGSTFHYIEDLAEAASPDVGAYLVEMETAGSTLSDRCWFQMKDQTVLSVKNPENASKSMMDYISTRLQEARDTLENGGVNPETGRTVEEDFDVDAFARTLLLQELSYNYDGFKYSSTYFVLPEGSKRFKPGPVWDFDLAWRYLVNGLNDDARAFKENGGWMQAFYQCDAFVQAMKQIYRDELYPMVQNILLGDGVGEYVKSLSAYAEEIDASRLMNEVLWQPVQQNRYLFGFDYEQEQALLRQFIAQRSQWLNEALAEDAYGADDVVLYLSGLYAHVDEIVHVQARPWNNASLRSFTWEQVSEADEENYAVWQAEIFLAPHEELSDPRVIINGCEVDHEVTDDGLIRVLVTFEDPSYRPVDYYGDDIGWIYNYDVYIENHPEVLDICGEDDPEAVMDYFCDEGMYEDHQGNAFFKPSAVLAAHPELEYMLGDDWSMYYWDYLYYGRETDKWTRYMGQCFWPEVESALE
ncbi:MAG: CotH kinase family protein [Clostridia bacterium]|nr:CotH kinase family protein [Clostridia bacterium]